MSNLQNVGATIDCADPVKLAAFWKAALGYEETSNFDNAFIMLSTPGAVQGKDTYLALQQVPEPKPGKNRVHLDFHTADRPAEVARLVELGATVQGEHTIPGITWSVLADPEGNEFCVAAPHV